jgi:hypothetical protein
LAHEPFERVAQAQPRVPPVVELPHGVLPVPDRAVE